MKKFFALFLLVMLAAFPAFAIQVLEDDVVKGDAAQLNCSTGLDCAMEGRRVNVTVNGSQAITGGTINGATIGASTPSSGAFTTLSASGMLSASGGFTGNIETLAATEALAATDSGKLLVLSSDTEFVTTLPAPAAGLNFTIIVGNAPESASYTVVTATSANIIQGCVSSSEDAAGSVSCAASADTITFVDGKAIVGDYVKLKSDGTSWFIVGGNCAVQDGITTTQAS